MHPSSETHPITGLEIAIVGLSGRFPGAANVDAFWRNLQAGVESIDRFSDAALQEAGVPLELLSKPNYVKAAAVLDDVDLFDAAFFSYAPRDATIIDPQHRIFLEIAWEALEHAGYDPARYPKPIGVYAGVGINAYLSLHSGITGTAEEYQVITGNHKDFLATRVSYKLNLTGPSMAVQTACSTSLVAVHLACQGLLSGDCDLALAGGVAIRMPQTAGYLHQAGGIGSPDGHCRAFDAAAQGTVFGSGAGVVVLKRLADALEDGDCIHAVIKGTAINNDGGLKIGYMAPSLEGQIKVIRAAHRMAEVEPDTITYVETHGTGTALGDPIEIAALTRAFRTGTDRTGFCALGSVKTNIGHTDTAAGVIGLIKTVLMLKHRQIPPSLHFSQPNPKIDFANSPFYVSTALAEWKTGGGPRRAGVSAFGAGGTNAHAILEEAPSLEPSGPSRPWHLLALSAKSPAALDRATAQLADHLRHHPDTPLADAAYTLQVGRQAFQHRRIVVGRDTSDAVAALEASPNQAGLSALWSGREPQVVFMFPGGGAQYVHMGRDLYATEPVFREAISRCAALLRPQLRLDLCDVLYPAPERAEEAAAQLRQPLLGLSALFVTEYALAKLWMSWGVRPQSMIGHSLGEYTAACLAGVMSLEDALAMVVRRGQLMEEVPAGAMLSVPLPEHEVRPLLTQRIALAAVNGPAQCVVSGETAAIDLLAAELAANGVQCRRLPIDVASHSAMVAPILESFGAFVATLRLQPPAIPYLSNVTGTWITATEPTAPSYWMQHLRQTVHFYAAAQALLEVPNRVFLEVGPGRTLSSLVRQQAGETAGALILSSLRHPTEEQSDVAFLMTALGKLWMAGVPVTWEELYAHERRRRCALPTYPFERQRYWIEARPERIHAEMLISSVQETAAGTPQQLTSDSSAAPRSETELRLAALWRGMLGTAQIGIHDSFFELGGDSLIAIQLLAKVRETFQTNLSLHSLLQAPTIADLAAQIEPASRDSAEVPAAASHPQLIEIQPGGSRHPIFFIHPVGGGVYPYQSIAQMLAGERPVYGIQAQGFDGQAEPLTCITEMATHYNRLIRAVQPEGPYLLAGASFGGVVAFEMAQQLTVSGQKVGLLALLDSPAPERVEAYITDETSIIASVLNIDAELPGLLEELRQLEPEAQLQVCFEHARASGSISADADIATFRRPIALLKTHIQALLNYRPQSYPGDLVFFRAAERDPLNPPHPEYGWMEYVGGGIIIYEVPGNHDSMLVRPHVQTLVERLRWHLKIADQGAL